LNNYMEATMKYVQLLASAAYDLVRRANCARRGSGRDSNGS